MNNFSKFLVEVSVPGTVVLLRVSE